MVYLIPSKAPEQHELQVYVQFYSLPGAVSSSTASNWTRREIRGKWSPSLRSHELTAHSALLLSTTLADPAPEYIAFSFEEAPISLKCCLEAYRQACDVVAEPLVSSAPWRLRLHSSARDSTPQGVPVTASGLFP
jgi:hypothetical protein